MNEKTRYRKAFDDLPENMEIDWDRIRNSRKPSPVRASALITAAAAVFMLSFTSAYALDQNFRSDFNLWITGRKTTAELHEIDAFHYEVLVTLPDGNQVTHYMYTDDTDHPLDAEEVIENYENLWEVAENDQGEVMFYWRNKIRNITEYFKPLDIPVEVTDEKSNEIISARVSEYCYYELDGRFYCIAHIVSPEHDIDMYTTTGMSMDSHPRSSLGGTVLPSYEEYAGIQKTYAEPERVREGTREYICYKNMKEDITDRLIPWGYEEDTPWSLEDGTETVCHSVYESFYYFRMDDQYISVFNETQTIDGSTMESLGLYYDTEGYVPIHTMNGKTAPLPENEPVSEADITLH